MAIGRGGCGNHHCQLRGISTILTSILVEEQIQLLLVDWGLGRVYQIPQRFLVEVVCGEIQPPLILRETVEGGVLICPSDGDKLSHFATLGLLQLVL